MSKDLPFDPSQATYAQRYVRGSIRKKDGSKQKKCGPYWYANWIEFGRLRTFYLGKELPEVCQPFAPPNTYIDNPSQQKRGAKPAIYRGASDSLLEVLDRGEQVIIDIHKIAKDCEAQMVILPDQRFLLYRDPK